MTREPRVLVYRDVTGVAVTFRRMERQSKYDDIRKKYGQYSPPSPWWGGETYPGRTIDVKAVCLRSRTKTDNWPIGVVRAVARHEWLRYNAIGIFKNNNAIVHFFFTAENQNVLLLLCNIKDDVKFRNPRCSRFVS